MKVVLRRVLRLTAFTYLGLMLLLAGCQNRLLYFPMKDEASVLVKRAGMEGLEPWKDAGGEIIGWHQKKAGATQRLVVFHGNAGYALHRTFYTEAFSQAGWEVFLFEYPGYGARAGTPGKDVFIEKGREAVESLLAADPRPLYLLGESIGSGTACALAGKMPEKIAGLVLVVPFARLVEVAKWHFPYLPIGLLLRDRFDNIEALAGYRGKVAVVVAEEDEVVSAAQGRKLFEAYQGPKRLILLPGARHNDFPTHRGADWYTEVQRFLLP